MNKVLWIFSLFNICAIYGEAITLDTLDSYRLTHISPRHIRDVEIVPVKDKKQPEIQPILQPQGNVAAKPSVLNFANVSSSYSTIENVRFENAKDLSKVVGMILNYKALHPEKVLWAVFDVDETLIDRTDSGKPIHSITNTLFKSLNDAGVPIILLTMSSDPRPKFTQARLAYKGVITKGLLSRDEKGKFVPKGKTLQKYIESLPKKQRPDHVFFADDQIFSDSGVESVLGKVAVYIQSVEETMRKMSIPYTTFHFQEMPGSTE